MVAYGKGEEIMGRACPWPPLDEQHVGKNVAMLIECQQNKARMITIRTFDRASLLQCKDH